MKRLVLILFLLMPLLAQEQATIVTYNLLDYDSDTDRDADFRTVLDELDPDVIVVQEIHTQAAVDNFLDNVLNLNAVEYSAGAFIPNDPINKALFYKSSRFTFLGNRAIPTVLRDINEFTLVHTSTQDTLYLYGVHLRAGTTQNDIDDRTSEAATLRINTDALPTGSNFLVLGDFNMQNSFEPGYANLLDTGNDGYFLDPIDRPGSWHSNSDFADIHTQSTRTRSFGGGATGGVDDRFDMVLISQAIADAGGVSYVSGSYLTFGNDGFHLNDSINHQPNTAVSPEIADALHDASDHLPVAVTLEFEAPAAGGEIVCSVDITPENGTDGVFSYAMTFANTTDSSHIVNLWAEITDSADNTSLVFLRNKSFGPFAGASKTRNYQTADLTPGTYSFTLFVGSYPDDVMSSATDTYVLLGDAADLVINELNYNPVESGTDSTEFIEIYNPGGTIVDLDGYFFSQGVTFTFPAGAEINPGEYLTITGNSSGFLNTYGFSADYEWPSDALSNSGEDVVLKDSGGIYRR